MCPKTLRNISDEICNPQSTEFKFNVMSFNELHLPVLSGVFRLVERGKWWHEDGVSWTSAVRLCWVLSLSWLCYVESGPSCIDLTHRAGLLSPFPPAVDYTSTVQYRESPGSFVFPSPPSRVPQFTYFRCRAWRDRLGAEPCEYASEIKNVTTISFLSKRLLWTENSY